MKSTQTENNQCKICGGLGYIITKCLDAQDLITPCKCQEVEKAKRLWKSSGINLEQSKQTFSTFKTNNQVTKSTKHTAVSYFQNFEKIRNARHNSIAILGQVGCGKTHLSIAIAVNMLSRGIPVIYMPYRDVITRLKQNIQDDEYYHKLISKYQTAKVLLIDDLFKGKLTDSDKSIMFELINYRYLNYLPMIVSSEFNTEKLLNYDEAVGSRIIEMCEDYTVEIQGKEYNYRLRNEIIGG